MAQSNSKLAAKGVDFFRRVSLATFDTTKGPIPTIGQRQRASRKDKGPPPFLWTAQVCFPAPEDDARNAVLEAVQGLGEEHIQIPSLTTSSVDVEWVGLKKVERKATTPAERYSALSSDTLPKGTILFVHGGGFHLNGLGAARFTAGRLAKGAQARVVSLDYRLAPQSAFPTQILDLLVTYLSLLYPPPGSLHEALPASSIVIAGESCGSGIALGFLQLLLFLEQNARKIRFHGRDVTAPKPAGFALVSPQAEVSLSLPSWFENAKFDIFACDTAPYCLPDFPADDTWPSSPPREELYCPASSWSHPMVSPCTAMSWQSAPPLWIAVGQERLIDSSKIIAQTASKEGVSVLWLEYDEMPHTWMFSLPKLPQAKHLWVQWGKACRELFDGSVAKSSGSRVDIESLEVRPVDIGTLTDLSVSDARRTIVAFSKTQPVYRGRQRDSQL